MTSASKLKLSLIPGDQMDGFKRLIVYTSLMLVKNHRNISDVKLASLLKQNVGASDLMVEATLKMFTHDQVLRTWKNKKLRNGDRTFYSVADPSRLEAICTECVNNHPEFAELEYCQT
jgi:hypothetical protein